MEQNQFDDLTKKLASPVSRGTALKTVMATALGGMVALGSAGSFASAASPDKAPKSCKCKQFLSCNNGFLHECSTSCQGSHFSSSYCFGTPHGKKGKLKGFCGVNSYCANVPACGPGLPACPAGTECAVSTGCNCSSTSGVCIPVCDTGCMDSSAPKRGVARGTAASG